MSSLNTFLFIFCYLIILQHKVQFSEATALPMNKNWSPYGCHYYPDPKAFPAPKLDSLPPEPLRKGEQYFLDLAGNICKVIEYFKYLVRFRGY